MNDSPMIFRFRDPGKRVEETIFDLQVDEVHVECSFERLFNLLGLALAEKPVVDEDTDELVADRLVHQCGCNR